MTRRFLFACLLLAAAPLVFAMAAASHSYHDTAYGFSFDLPAFGSRGQAPVVQRMFVFAAPEDNFAPNINVQVQFQKTTREQYVKATEGELASAELVKISSQSTTVSGLPAAIIEYQGPMQGRNLHFLALAVIGSDRVWLATCTAPVERYPKLEKEFRAALASFEIRP